MKEWKQEIINRLNTEAQSIREIHFYDVAKEMGYKHISTRDCQDIIGAFLKQNPTYRVVRFCTQEQMNDRLNNPSLFTSCVLTELEYNK